MTHDQLSCYRATGTRCGACPECDQFVLESRCLCYSSHRMPHTSLRTLTSGQRVRVCNRCGLRRVKPVREIVTEDTPPYNITEPVY